MGGERREKQIPFSKCCFILPILDEPSPELRNEYLNLFDKVQISSSNGSGEVNGVQNRDQGVRFIGKPKFCNATVTGYGPSSHDYKERRTKADHFNEPCDPERGCALARLERDQGVNGFIVSGNCCEPCNRKTS